MTAAPSSCGNTTISAEYQGVVGQTQLTVSCPASAPVLQSINLYPSSPTIPQVGDRVDFLALAVYLPAQSNNDVSTQATWKSGNEGVVTVNAGLASAISCGSTTIQAEYLGVVTQTPLTVQCASNLKSLTILPGSPVIPQIGQTTQFAVIGTYLDGTQQDLTRTVSWSSSNLQIATLDPDPTKPGLVNAVSCGTSTISAQSQNILATTQLTVSCGSVTSIELLVLKTGLPNLTGSVTIESSPAGISCGATCSTPFNEGTFFILTALGPAVPTLWQGCDHVSQDRVTCYFTLEPDPTTPNLKTVTANY